MYWIKVSWDQSS